jgi:hypothetical protein
MTDYQLTATEFVIRTSDGASIPPGHRWHDEYLAWVAAGNMADPYVAPLPNVPLPDANERLDAGISAAILAAEEVRNGLHAIPANFNAANFQQFLLQAKILSDAFLAMLQAQADD